jgi:hypothetical protein
LRQGRPDATLEREETVLKKSISDKIDVVIPYHDKDSDVIEMCIQGCINNVRSVRNIYVITSSTIPAFEGIRVVNEERLFTDGLSKRYVKSKLRAACPNLVRRSGCALASIPSKPGLLT